MTKISEETFEEKFIPQINHIVREQEDEEIEDNDICGFSGCLYETYGEELDYVLEMANNPNEKNKVWTIISCEDDDGNENIVYQAGYKLVNRMGYLITENPFENEEQFVVTDF